LGIWEDVAPFLWIRKHSAYNKCSSRTMKNDRVSDNFFYWKRTFQNCYKDMKKIWFILINTFFHVTIVQFLRVSQNIYQLHNFCQIRASLFWPGLLCVVTCLSMTFYFVAFAHVVNDLHKFRWLRIWLSGCVLTPQMKVSLDCFSKRKFPPLCYNFKPGNFSLLKR